jgi:hypothetical protein
MQRLYSVLLVTCTVFCLAQKSTAQDIFLNATFRDVTFEKFVESVESRTPYRFYYDSKSTDSVVVNVDLKDSHLAAALDEILSGTELHYAIDGEGNVYITQAREIMVGLPDDFFNTGLPSTRKAYEFDYTEYEKREKKRKQIEGRLYTIGTKTNSLQGKATLAGYVKSAANGEPVVGASVFIENPLIGVPTDAFGFFSITLPKGKHELKVKSIGMKSTSRQLLLYGDGKVDVDLEEDVLPLKEVIVESDRDVKVTSLQMGLERLDIKTMRQMPLALGETDIMKVIMTLPGVQTVGEGTVGLNVRGGAATQNLILFNDATIYNPSHLFGFFSTFNPDVLKGVELYKSGITADFGGRLSSVLDVKGREGNLKKVTASGGISPITGRLTFEGPIIKDKTSFLVGVRSTYSDWILKQLDSKQLRNSTASFYDVNLNLNHKFSDKDHLYASAYFSHDDFKLGTDTTYSYSDRNATLKWKHIFNNKFLGIVTGGFSQYDYSIGSTRTPLDAFKLDLSIGQINAKADFSYFLNPKHTFQGGLGTINYRLSQGNLQPDGSQSLVKPDQVPKEQGLESFAYLGDNFEVSQKISLYAGVRFSFFQYLGPKDVYVYEDGQSKDASTIVDTLHYGHNKPIATYAGAEPRFSVRYSLPRNASVKFSYNRMRQYVQVLSNTTTIAPTDLWKLSDSYVKPQVGDQVSIGYYKNWRGTMFEFSAEAYYKTIQNAVDFKNAAVVLLNHHVETDIVNANGKAYGIEFLIKKSAGKFNGWISYTYSRSLLQTNNAYSAEIVNNGAYYPSSYDKPTAFNVVSNYKFNRRFNMSWNLTYSTGRPITLPLAKYDLHGSTRVYYSDRNEYRIPDYFRVDFSINMEGNHKVKKFAHSSWTFAIYNLTGRQNAYSIFFKSENGKINGYKLSIFGQPIPTITYNFRI